MVSTYKRRASLIDNTFGEMMNKFSELFCDKCHLLGRVQSLRMRKLIIMPMQVCLVSFYLIYPDLGSYIRNKYSYSEGMNDEKDASASDTSLQDVLLKSIQEYCD
jgi:hypothetical protein